MNGRFERLDDDAGSGCERECGSWGCGDAPLKILYATGLSPEMKFFALPAVGAGAGLGTGWCR